MIARYGIQKAKANTEEQVFDNVTNLPKVLSSFLVSEIRKVPDDLREKDIHSDKKITPNSLVKHFQGNRHSLAKSSEPRYYLDAVVKFFSLYTEYHCDLQLMPALLELEERDIKREAERLRKERVLVRVEKISEQPFERGRPNPANVFRYGAVAAIAALSALLVAVAWTRNEPESTPIVTQLPNEKLTSEVTSDLSGTVSRPKETPKLAKLVRFPFGDFDITALALSKDARYLAVGDEDWNINVYFAESGVLAARLTGHEGRAVSLDFSPDGDLIASGSADGTARIWSIGKKKQIRLFRDRPKRSTSAEETTNVRFSPNGEMLAFGGQTSEVQVVRIGDEKVIARYSTNLQSRTSQLQLQKEKDEACPGFSLAISPECARANNRLTASTQENRAEEKARFQRSKYRLGIADISYSPDGRFIATVSHERDSDIQIFDLETHDFDAKIRFYGKSGAAPRHTVYNPNDLSLIVMGDRKIGTTETKEVVQLRSLTPPFTGKSELVYQGNLIMDRAYPPSLSPDGRIVGILGGEGAVFYDLDADIIASEITDRCLRRYVQVSGGSPPIIATDGCNSGGIFVAPLTLIE